MGQLSHVVWVPVAWANDRGWRFWSTVDPIPLFVDPPLIGVLTVFKLHSIGRPGKAMICREPMDFELELGGLW